MRVKYPNKELCTVFTKNGQHFIKTPKGEILVGLMFTRVTDSVDEIPFVLCKMMVNLENNHPFIVDEIGNVLIGKTKEEIRLSGLVNPIEFNTGKNSEE